MCAPLLYPFNCMHAHNNQPHFLLPLSRTIRRMRIPLHLPPSSPINGTPLAPYNVFSIPAVLLSLKISLGHPSLLHMKERTETTAMAAPFLFPSSLSLICIKTGRPCCCTSHLDAKDLRCGKMKPRSLFFIVKYYLC